MKLHGSGYHLFDTAFGVCGVAWSDRGLTRLQLPECDRQATEKRLRERALATTAAHPPAGVAAAIRQLQRYFEGQRADFAEIGLDLGDTPPFFQAIYRLTRAVGWGEIATYGELADRAGSPGSARAVGQAMARNPIPIIIPCHRVLAANRKVGGFSAFGGTLTKERLLAMEGVSLAAELPLFAIDTRERLRFSAGSRS